MVNLTIEHKIVKEKGEDINPERGFDLVIFKNHKFDRIVHSGQKVSKGLLDRFQIYEVYAVNKDPNQVLSFRSSLQHNDNVHEFHIDYEISFRVVDAQLIVERLKGDPLKSVKKKVERVIGKYLSYAEWTQIEDMNAFRQLKDRALNDMLKTARHTMETNFDQIVNFAVEFGIEVEAIDFERTLIEKFTEVHRKRVEFEMIDMIEDDEHRLNLKRKDREEDIRAKDQGIERREHFSVAINTAVKVVAEKISGGIEDIEELKKVLIETKEIQDLFQSGAFSSSSAGSLGSGEQYSRLLEGGENKTLSSVCYQIFHQIKKAELDEYTLKHLLSILLRLISIKLIRFEDDQPDRYLDLFVDLNLSHELRGKIKEALDNIQSCVEKNQLL